MKLLLSYFIVQLKSSLIYIVSMLSNLFGQIVQTILLFFFWKHAYHASDEIIKYVIWCRVAMGFIGNNSVWGLAEEIRNGNVSLKLLKPIGYFQYTYIAYIAKQLVNVFIIGIPLVVVAWMVSPVHVSILQFLLCIVSISLSVTISFCFDYYISLLCIYTQNTWGISALRDGLVQILSGSVVPLYLFPSHILKIIYIFPFAYMVDVPVKILIENRVEINLFLFQVIYCSGMLVMAVVMEDYFLKKMKIQGG